MNKNMGNTDRIIRTVVAVAAAVLIVTGVVKGVLAIVLGVAAVIFVATSAVSFCPIYTVFGMSTCKVPAKEKQPLS